MAKNINESINLDELVVTPKGASFSSNKTGVQPTTTKYWRIKVKPGDNLTKLANQYNTTVDELVKINNLKDPNSIYAGLDLRVVSREKENKNYASDYIQAVKNIAEVRKIDTRHAATLLDELISQGTVKFDGTPLFIMPSKASTASKVQGYKTKETKEARERDTRSRDFNFTKTYVSNLNAAWKNNPEVMQAFKEAGDATGYGAVAIGLAPTVVNTVIPTATQMAKELVLHPILNFVVPLITSDLIDKGLENWTNLDEKTRDLIATTLGFTSGHFLTDLLKSGISKELVKRGKGYLLESGSKYSNLLQNQLLNKYTSLNSFNFNPKLLFTKSRFVDSIKSLANYGLTNFRTYGIPELVPGLGLYTSHYFTGKSLGENIEEYTGLNSDIGDMLAEGMLDVGSNMYQHALEYTKASMSGGKKGFKNNRDYVWNKSGKTEDDFKFTKHHPILGRLNTLRRFIFVDPGPFNYQQAVNETKGKGHGSTNYVANSKNAVSDLLFVNYWFNVNDASLGNKLEKRGNIAYGNTDTSTGNVLEKFVKGTGSVDGRFEIGSRANIVTTPGSNTEEILSEASFFNFETGKYEPIFKNGLLNENIKSGTYGSRTNVFLDDATIKDGRKKFSGTMLDIDGHMELKIKTKNGKFGYAHIDLIGPGSGAGELKKNPGFLDRTKDVLVRSTSNVSSREMIPTYSVTLSGARDVWGEKDKSGIFNIEKIMNPNFSDTDNFTLALENIDWDKFDKDKLVRYFGRTDENGNYIFPEFKLLVDYRNNMVLKRKNIENKINNFKSRNLDNDLIKALKTLYTKAVNKGDYDRANLIGSALEFIQNPPSMYKDPLGYFKGLRAYNKYVKSIDKEIKLAAHRGVIINNFSENL